MSVSKHHDLPSLPGVVRRDTAVMIDPVEPPRCLHAGKLLQAAIPCVDDLDLDFHLGFGAAVVPGVQTSCATPNDGTDFASIKAPVCVSEIAFREHPCILKAHVNMLSHAG